MYSIYALHNSKHNKIYVGQTVDLQERIKLHNSKAFTSSFTSKFDGEWNLIYKEEVFTRKEALVREKQLKSYRGREFVKKYIPR